MKTITIYTPDTHYAASYGLIAGELARHLTRRGVYVNLLHYDGSAVHSSQPLEIQRIARNPFMAEQGGGILLGHPTLFHHYPKVADLGPRLALTMWESTVLPDGWTSVLNGCDAVVTPSRFCRDIFHQNGVDLPRIFVAPLGIHEAYQYVERTPPQAEQGHETAEVPPFGLKDRAGLRFLEYKPFTVLVIGDRGSRKGANVALGAFANAFGWLRGRCIVKTRPLPQPLFEFGNPNIETLCADLSVEDMARLYGLADVMVFASRGEGFGLPPREFAATGGIALVTRWGGLEDDLMYWGLPVDEYTEVPAWQGYDREGWEGLGVWAEPDMGTVAEKLRLIAAMPFEERIALGQDFARQVRDLYVWEEFADQVLDAWACAQMNYNQRHLESIYDVAIEPAVRAADGH